MNRVFVDTSAILALLVPSDRSHEEACRIFAGLKKAEAPLLTTSYVLIETYALLGRRLGLSAVESFRSDFAPLFEVRWVDEEFHERGLDLLLEQRGRRRSLVDTTSFVVIRDLEIGRVFAFDQHFSGEEFPLLGSDSN